MKYYVPVTNNVSGLTWDTDMTVPAGNKIQVDHIEETTPGHGVTIADLILIDTQSITTDDVNEKTADHGVRINNLYARSVVTHSGGAHVGFGLDVDYIRAGFRKDYTTTPVRIASITLHLLKNGNPVGNAVIRIRSLADAILATSSTILDMSTLTGVSQPITFHFAAPQVLLAQDVRVCLEGAPGAGNSVDIRHKASGDATYQRSLFIAAWADSGVNSFDCEIEYLTSPVLVV